MQGRIQEHSINEFIIGYCSEPRLSFNKTVFTRYRIHLESRQLAPGIRCVKGAKRLGVCLGNWLEGGSERQDRHRTIKMNASENGYATIFFNLLISFSRRSRRDSVCTSFCSALFKNWFRSLWYGMPVFAAFARRMSRLPLSMFIVILTDRAAVVLRRICCVPLSSITRSLSLGSFIVKPRKFSPRCRSEDPDIFPAPGEARREYFA